MQNIRPAGSGKSATCGAFVRELVSPYAALIFVADAGVDPGDWPTSTASRIADSQLGHALGWVCEVRRNDVVLLDPLGEGVLRADLPDLSAAWKHQVRATSSAAVFLVPAPSVVEKVSGAEPGSPEWVELALTGHHDPIRAASVRTALAEDAGSVALPGRNEPCHCGSGKKFKACHGRP
jgi:hypothetical protein